MLNFFFLFKEFQYRGRIRVQTRNDDGSYINPELNSRDAVMMYAAKRIPQLKTRQNKGDHDHHHQHYSTQQTTGGNTNSKKNKSRRR